MNSSHVAGTWEMPRPSPTSFQKRWSDSYLPRGRARRRQRDRGDARRETRPPRRPTKSAASDASERGRAFDESAASDATPRSGGRRGRRGRVANERPRGPNVLEGLEPPPLVGVDPARGLKGEDPERVEHVVSRDAGRPRVDLVHASQRGAAPSGARALLANLVHQQRRVVVARLAAARELARPPEDGRNRRDRKRREEAERRARVEHEGELDERELPRERVRVVFFPQRPYVRRAPPPERPDDAEVEHQSDGEMCGLHSLQGGAASAWVAVLTICLERTSSPTASRRAKGPRVVAIARRLPRGSATWISAWRQDQQF
mmetsp:Transcript_10833/g.33403  ORF Transcript_10833/g.33403 Transcript_10833/m.33403 type:complete len:318 (+) Transcript_10833:577-1530(+)